MTWPGILVILESDSTLKPYRPRHGPLHVDARLTQGSGCQEDSSRVLYAGDEMARIKWRCLEFRNIGDLEKTLMGRKLGMSWGGFALPKPSPHVNSGVRPTIAWDV